MLKKLFILGMAAMTVLCAGCGKETVKTEEEISTVYEDSAEEMEELVDVLTTEITAMYVDMYVEAIEGVFGESIDESQLSYDVWGVTYKDQTVSWEYLDEVAYNQMINSL